jgi:hypothetical protein
VAKVRRGEQVDPTGQYVKDGTMVAANADAISAKRPKLDVATQKLPFALYADGTYIMLPKTSTGGTANRPAPPDDPIMNCPGNTNCPVYGVVTSTFVASAGQGAGSGPIVDLKVAPNKPIFNGYTVLDSDLNKGAGGREIYFQFTRDGASVLKGLEYNSPNYTFSPADPLMSFTSGTGSTFSQPRAPVYYSVIWNANNSPNVYWITQDLNAGAGGAYVYSFQSKDSRSRDAVIFREVGILSGNSESIIPPTGWVKWPNDLNEGTGGDFIYFCYLP